MNARPKPSVTRDRLLLAAAQLLHESPGGTVSTRAVCERAGVQAPTLYHHFGSKQGLLDAVVNYGFTQYIRGGEPGDTGDGEPGGDPVERVRQGWDDHVRYGLDHPSFYVLLYGQIEPGVPCTLTSRAEAMLLDLLTAVAREGRLRVSPAEAARQIAAANVGVTLSLISRPDGEADLGTSHQVREALIAALIDDASTPPDENAMPTIRTLAVTLSAALEGGTAALSAGEVTMLREWLSRLADQSPTA
ncbi:TetR/AcrR family transcriptional regulator [Planotetraspora kaengkrachanensis]|uniref:TetR family transcriptional regulator n=1 Tax=Planotetraspora kaengkrachanensis TaxID=575193 RepID=A0A8J3PXA5_9ACTN|nr:TetR/AcrR family transcriptional regulator [Planotetraspora kaengkrachanensis]GIG82785.1 TetR family transcriptional regulator [Planotetraspora kaengkrachanensis]